jgi:Phosphodiester glycosidase/FlgD Ig-like domain
MLRRVATIVLLSAAFAAPAHAAGPLELMPGVTYEKTVQFTPHGAVVLHVITAPRPDPAGLYQLGAVLGHGTMVGGRERVTQIEKDVSSQATVAGINGDLFSSIDGHPAGVFMSGGVLEHPPLAGRSSIGIDSTGLVHVDRVKFFGTWKGTGQRRPLNGLNQVPAPGQVILFTPSYGLNAPAVPGAAEVVLQTFPASLPNVDVAANVTAVGVNGGEAIPPGGAILMATGLVAAKLQAEAPVGTALTTRLILQPAWTGVVSALGGGPVLLRNGQAVFRSLEDFTNDQITERDPRAGVGQLADGRVVLVAVDGRQPGYSVGLTSFELAQTMQRLGAVTASAVDSGGSVSVAFDGQLLNRPSDPGGERLVKEALLVQYFGVYAAPLPLPLLNGDPGKTGEPFSYKVVRPSVVTAKLIGPDGVPRVLEAAVQHSPGTYPFAFSTFDVEGTWHWNVTATDDLGRVSTIDRAFRYDTTLRGLQAPKLARASATVRFTLSRPAKVTLQIETRNGVIVRTLPVASLPAGSQSLIWDGRLPHGTSAYAGTYVAHVFATTASGTSDLATQFGFRRG